ncbi:MAG: hypothetical protein AABZ13_00240, partial [Planctomycetota bacterium]
MVKGLYRLGFVGILCGVLAACTSPSFAEESKTENFFKSIEISGFVDTYYSYNFSRPNDRRGSTPG